MPSDCCTTDGPSWYCGQRVPWLVQLVKLVEVQRSIHLVDSFLTKAWYVDPLFTMYVSMWLAGMPRAAGALQDDRSPFWAVYTYGVNWWPDVPRLTTTRTVLPSTKNSGAQV